MTSDAWRSFREGDKIKIFYRTGAQEFCTFVSFNYAGIFMVGEDGKSFYVPYSSIEKLRFDG